jgi:phosphoribosylformimino-5-aminoimidazole carboxamide ribotide isomerase
MNFRPCIDIHNGKVKQIVGSTLGADVQINFETNKSGQDFAEIFAKYGLKGGHICVLDRDEASFDLAKSVTKKYKNWQIGGGINERTAEKYLKNGADKVIVSSGLFDGDDVFDRAKFLSEKIGKENLVFDLSCKAFEDIYFVMKDGWKTKTSLAVNVKSLEKLSQFCSEFLVHGVTVEGKNAGFDEVLVMILTDFVEKNKFPVVYAGGLNSLEDIRKFKKLSKNLLDFTIGSSLNVYGGRVSLDSFLTE